MWVRYDAGTQRKAIISHENFTDKNMGGWNLYHFDDRIRLHSVKQPYFHDTADMTLQTNDWTHISLNVQSLGHGKIKIDFYSNGKFIVSHEKLNIFLKDQVELQLGGLTKDAIKGFDVPDNYYYEGSLAEVVYMNETLSAEQIKELYESSKELFK